MGRRRRGDQEAIPAPCAIRMRFRRRNERPFPSGYSSTSRSSKPRSTNSRRVPVARRIVCARKIGRSGLADLEQDAAEKAPLLKRARRARGGFGQNSTDSSYPVCRHAEGIEHPHSHPGLPIHSYFQCCKKGQKTAIFVQF